MNKKKKITSNTNDNSLEQQKIDQERKKAINQIVQYNYQKSIKEKKLKDKEKEQIKKLELDKIKL